MSRPGSRGPAVPRTLHEVHASELQAVRKPWQDQLVSEAISDGALPKCEYIHVQENDFDQSGKQFLKAATKPRGIRVHFGWPPPLPGVEYD